MEFFFWNSKLFIHENASENIVCEIAAILPRERLVKTGEFSWHLSDTERGRQHNLSFVLRTYIDGLMQEKCNPSALAMELRLSCTNLSIYSLMHNTIEMTWWNCCKWHEWQIKTHMKTLGLLSKSGLLHIRILKRHTRTYIHIPLQSWVN